MAPTHRLRTHCHGLLCQLCGVMLSLVIIAKQTLHSHVRPKLHPLGRDSRNTTKAASDELKRDFMHPNSEIIVVNCCRRTQQTNELRCMGGEFRVIFKRNTERAYQFHYCSPGWFASRQGFTLKMLLHLAYNACWVQIACLPCLLPEAFTNDLQTAKCLYMYVRMPHVICNQRHEEREVHQELHEGLRIHSAQEQV